VCGGTTGAAAHNGEEEPVTTPATHMGDLLTHTLTRGPRVAAPPDATEEERRRLREFTLRG
jgi:hypothetical protein